MLHEKLPPAGAVYAIGNFDGVHPGHRRLFDICREIADRDGSFVCALTFDGLTKEGGRLITDIDREYYLRDAGADHVLCEDFESIRHMTPEEFVRDHLVGILKPSAVVCGKDFRFGRMGSGNVEMLRELLVEYGMPVYIADTVIHGGAPVSTSRIKEALAEGDVISAETLLGRRYSFAFPVVEGKRLGRKLGAPTINQHFPEGMFIPKFGVYAGDTEICGKVYPCVTNIGIRPTVDDGNTVTAETYIIGYGGDLYGEVVRVRLSEYLREERRFDSVEALAEQITADAAMAEEIFSE